MSLYHKFYIKQMNLELEALQPIYVKKIMNFLECLMISRQRRGYFLSGCFRFFMFLNNEYWACQMVRYWRRLGIEDVDVFCQDVYFFVWLTISKNFHFSQSKHIRFSESTKWWKSLNKATNNKKWQHLQEKPQDNSRSAIQNAVTTFWLLDMTKCLHQICIFPSPICPLCGHSCEEIDEQHLVCTVLESKTANDLSVKCNTLINNRNYRNRFVTQCITLRKVSDLILFCKNMVDFNKAFLHMATLKLYTHIFSRLSIVAVDDKQRLSEVVFSALVGFSL